MQLLLKNDVTTQRRNEVMKKKASAKGWPFLFWYRSKTLVASRLAGSGDVAAEDAEFAGGGTDVGEGSVESGNIAGFDINEKLVFPGAAVNGAAFNLQQIHAVLRERIQRSK